MCTVADVLLLNAQLRVVDDEITHTRARRNKQIDRHALLFSSFFFSFS